MKKLVSFVALVGMLTACQLERIETAYSLANAVATINVTVLDINTGVTPIETFNVTASEGTVSGTTITITGNPSISEADVTVYVEYDGDTYYEIVHVNRLSAGGTATYSVTIIVGELIVDEPEKSYYVTVSAGAPVTTHNHEVGEGDSSVSGPTYAYDSDLNVTDWYINGSETYMLEEVTYTMKTGSELVDVTVDDEDYRTTIENLSTIYANYSTYSSTTMLTFSAYCYYNAVVTYEMTTTVYTINLVNVDDSTDVISIGSFTLCEYSTSIAPVESAYTSDHGHGHYSHGHGNGYNAGGGIIVSE